MTSKNPLTAGSIPWMGQTPSKNLHQFAAELNQRNFVRDQGAEYVVLHRKNDRGDMEEYLERRMIRQHRVWKPSPQEMAATSAVVAHHAADPHLLQVEFNRMCERGIITRQVEREMSRELEPTD